jgi:NtrC-family two-component system response regulator AlgB
MDEQDQPLVLNVLVVDDEPNIRKTLSYCLAAEGHVVISVSKVSEAIDEATRRSFDIAFVDLRLGNESGMDLIPYLLADSPWMKIVVITAYASIETAVEAMRRGAMDYLPKPFKPDQVRHLTRKIQRVRDLETQVEVLKERVKRLGPQVRLHSHNTTMERVIDTARRAAPSDAVILLRGESGTGKSIFATAIHQWSPRARKPLGVVSCPAIPSELIESELFGHVKGAFTGAVRDNPGRIAFCEGGTLFLDEIADLAPSLQTKLLRFIEDKQFERLGDPTVRRADVRIFAATNANLEERVADGRFREDLFYRLNVITIAIPPLRDRREDILPLAREFLAFFSLANHRTFGGFTEEALTFLMTHGWPGNVRELRNVVERAAILGRGSDIGIEDLPDNRSRQVPCVAPGDRVSLAALEEDHIRRIITSTSSLQEAAEVLGIDQSTLWRKRKTYCI